MHPTIDVNDRLDIDIDTETNIDLDLDTRTGSDRQPVTMLALGTTVEVRRRFDQAWARGFEVADTDPEGYRLRRCSDGSLLPVSFPTADVRRAST